MHSRYIAYLKNVTLYKIIMHLENYGTPIKFGKMCTLTHKLCIIFTNTYILFTVIRVFVSTNSKTSGGKGTLTNLSETRSTLRLNKGQNYTITNVLLTFEQVHYV